MYTDESFVERTEVVYPNSDVIDTEPYYSNFTTIQKALEHDYEQKQSHMINYHRSHSTDGQYQAIRTLVEPSSLRHSQSNESLDVINTRKPVKIPITIESKRIDGHIFNLTKIIDDIGCNRNTPFIRSSLSDSNTKNVSALLNIVLKMGGANGPLVNVWRSRIDNDYFQRWYLEKHHQRSASLIQQNTINSVDEKTTQYAQNRDHRSNLVIDNLVSNKLPIKTMTNENYYQNEIKRTYGFDQTDRMSSTSSHSSLNEIEWKNNFSSNQNRPLPTITSILRKPDAINNGNSPTRHVTIRTTNPTNEFNQSISSQQVNYSVNNNQNVLSDYQKFIQNHPDLRNDPNPEIVVKPNPNQVTYQQNVSVRYLSPPTPPPPGPLIIREIVPHRPPTPPPVIIKYQEPSPPTPPPLILREAPPPPPPQQEPTIITKVLPPEPQPPRRVIVEKSPPLPPKPQDVIIEKWLPYKPAPPREVIYERVVENPPATQYRTDSGQFERQRRHSAEFQTNAARVQVSTDMQRKSSTESLDQRYIVEQSAPTQEITYDYIVENPNVIAYDTSNARRERQRSHSADMRRSSSQISMGANMQQQYAIQQQPLEVFDELSWRTHQQMLTMQEQGRQQLQAHQQWAANLWQQHANMFGQFQMQLPANPMFVYHQPIALQTASYVERQEYQQQIQYNPTFAYPFM